jgi:flagellar hook assembly protein FlgD
VRVEVVDVAGRRVTLLLDQALDAGSHSIRWDGRDGTGNAVVPGVYLVRLSTGGVSATRKVVAIR